MHSKDSGGNWRTNFDAHLFGGGTNLQDVTEGTSSQYSWFVPHDVPGLISLMGGKEKFAAKLDSLFDAQQSEKFTRELSANDLRGCIGEYWHGNEPSHHVIYLYCLCRPAVEGGGTLASGGRDTIRQRSRFALWQR